MNMRLSKEVIEKFREIYEEEFDEKITDADACEKFLRLVNLLRVILKVPIKKGQDQESPGPSSFDDNFKNGKLKD